LPLNGHFIFLLYSFAVGACVGSFLNVVIYRLPAGRSIVSPPSSCPKCGARIRWYDNIPLLSYLLLGGRCRNCREPIPLRYPLVEFLTALLFGFLYAVDRTDLFGEAVPLSVFLVHCAFAAALVAVTFIDFDHKIIPNEISVGGTVVALVLSALMPGRLAPVPDFLSAWPPPLAGLGTSLIGGAAGAGITLLTAWLGKLAFRKDAMGMGDVKLMAMIGCLLGWQAALVVFFTAPFFGLLVAVPQLFLTKDHYVAYGPFLSLAALLFMLFRPAYMDFLARLTGF